MAIDDKTRNVLWGRSGNRCAICKRELVAETATDNSAAVVGEMCRIVSTSEHGPRYDDTYPKDKADFCENLMLLCPLHRKMVDNLNETFTTSVLRLMKVTHENWISQKLGDTQESKPVKIRIIERNVPQYLVRITTGRQLLDLVDKSDAFNFENDDLDNESEVELITGFFRLLQEWGDIDTELDAAQRSEIKFRLNDELKHLDNAGFAVFGAAEIQIMEGENAPPTDFPVALIKVIRKSSKVIKTVSLSKLLEARDSGGEG
jgi:hypothetical protein